MKKAMWKKSLAIVLCLTMLLMTACGKQPSEEGTTAAPTPTKGTEAGKNDETQAPGTEAVDYPEYVTEPITIEFWHTRGNGVNGENMTAMIDEFNATNEYGITVKGVFQGSATDLLSKVMASSTSGDNPVLTMVYSGSVEPLADAGLLVDMTGYMERDGFDINNIPEGLLYYACHEEGTVTSLPYVISSTLLFYNKNLVEKVPSTIQELYAMAEEIYKEKGIPGWGMIIGDTGQFMRPIMISLGANGLVTEDGMTADALETGEMLKVLADWRKGIDEGYIAQPDVTNETATMRNLFATGQLAMMPDSSGGMKNVMNLCAGNNTEMAVAPFVGYDGYCASINGGNLAMIGGSSTQQEQAAAWEFIKFLLSDENMVRLHKETGYLPATKSAAESAECQAFWEEFPGFKVAFNQLGYAKCNEWSLYGAEWKAKAKEAVQYVLITKEMTPEDAIEFLKGQVSVVFP